MRIEPGQHREKRAGSVIFEPMGREKAGVGVAIPAEPPGKTVRGSGAFARRRMKKEGGMIFEPMGREKAPGGAARKDRPGKRSVCPAEDDKGGGLCR